MNLFKQYIKLLPNFLKTEKFNSYPKELYEPLHYFLLSNGKKLRPVMCLMACDLFSGNLKTAIRPALAIEYFHNFTLIHDDIIDKATIRRNKPTVHEQYSVNRAILSGDALLVKSYQLFDKLPSVLYKKCLTLFSKTAIKVCEGQQMDMNFENQKKISLKEYIKMISYKTGALSALPFRIGALLANAKPSSIKLIYQYGLYLGIAFQIMDDYLDVFGNQKLFGKKHGGDIYKNKKTILYFLSFKNGSKHDKKELNYWYSVKNKNKKKIFAVEKIFRKLEIGTQTIEIIRYYNKKSIKYLHLIDIDYKKKTPLFELSDYLLNRNV